MLKIVRVVVRLKGRSALARLDQARYVAGKMKANPNFPTLAAQVTELEDAADTLETAITNANTGDHEAVGLKELAESDVEMVMAKLCDSINGVALGDKAKLLTCGLPLRKESSPIGELPPPTRLVSKLTTTTGRAALVFKGSYGARTYGVYKSTTEAPYNWVLIGTTSKQKYNADGLQPGTFYYFAVSAIGTAGESSLSEPARVMAAA